MNRPVISGDGIRHMRCAKQRVDCEMVPAGRCILFLEALITCAIRIAIERKGKKEADEAEEFLNYLSPECIL
eukprot:6740270-Pyramimonas_sp.AAC.1